MHRPLPELPEKVHLTASRYNGLQVSLEAKFPGWWGYVGFGHNDYRTDLVVGSATQDDVTETMRVLADGAREDPVRYAASYMDNLTTLFELKR